eukprot:CAMPEP_0181316890 /NCGR_PEP_ID=MMETSP1101-20121128/16136_1 /TAXON_ID=46948 /ORGANISM="Rhodomonas abbreviata, Strain Caron Lab Isolate" /LENGTH=332 /DNA_ID=CAMNT_0023424167 /DNA_START=114 /DNA_END=1112 /DNA_ORIENTATION=+
MDRQAGAQRRQAEEPRACYGTVETEHLPAGGSEHGREKGDTNGNQFYSSSNEFLLAYRKSSKVMRTVVLCILFSASAPFLLLAPEIDKSVKALPTLLPSQKWGFTRSWGGRTYEIEPSNIQQHSHAFQAVNSASQLGSKAVHRSSGAIKAADSGSSQLADNQTSISDPVQADEGTGRHSIFSFGPFMFSVGLLLAIIIKLICAPPCAKAGTDFWNSFMRSQLEKDEALGAAQQQQQQQQQNSARSSNTTPHRENSTRSSDSKRSSDGGRWPCKLDLPDAPTPSPLRKASYSKQPPANIPGAPAANLEAPDAAAEKGSARTIADEIEEGEASV